MTHFSIGELNKGKHLSEAVKTKTYQGKKGNMKKTKCSCNCHCFAGQTYPIYKPYFCSNCVKKKCITWRKNYEKHDK